jgi:signal peptidase I
MMPTLQAGDYIMATKSGYPGSGVKRGDLAVFHPPDRRDEVYVDRVVAQAGETIEIRGKSVYIDDHVLEEPYIHRDSTTSRPHQSDFGPLRVPAGAAFMMGDNRDASRDSRLFGPVGNEAIEGRALYIYFSRDPGRIGRTFQQSG